MKSSLITAFALMLLIEGVLPFVSPARWREVFRKAVLMEAVQIRFIGLSSILIGLVLLLVFND